MQGEWVMTGIYSQLHWLDTLKTLSDSIPYTSPNYASRIKFDMRDTLVNAEEWGDSMTVADGHIKMLDGTIFGSPSPNSEPDSCCLNNVRCCNIQFVDPVIWPFQWKSSQDTMNVLIYDRTFPRTLIIHKVTEDSLYMELEYFWYEHWMKFARLEK